MMAKTLYFVSHVIFHKANNGIEYAIFQPTNTNDRIYARKGSALRFMNFLVEKFQKDNNIEFEDCTEKYLENNNTDNNTWYTKNGTIVSIMKQKTIDEEGFRHMIKIVSYNLQEN